MASRLSETPSVLERRNAILMYMHILCTKLTYTSSASYILGCKYKSSKLYLSPGGRARPAISIWYILALLLCITYAN